MWLLLGSILLISSACNTRKYLQADEVLLVRNKIEILSDMPLADRNALKYELQTQIAQKPNDRSLIFFKPRLWFYYRQQERGDSTDFDKFVQRRLVEPPALYDTLATQETKRNMEELVFNKGYLDSEVWYEDTVLNQKAIVTYYIKPNHLYQVRDFNVVSSDSIVNQVLESHKKGSFLHPGEPVSNTLLGLEKQRIISILQEEGYANITFNNFDKLEATDTTGGKVAMRLRILPNQNGKLSRKYVGNIRVNNRSGDLPLALADKSIHEGISFYNFDQKNSVNPSTLLKYIHLRPGELYRKPELNRTRVELQLPAIQFADIRAFQRDSSDVVDFEIDILPAKKIETDTEVELNRTTVSSQSFVGVGSSLNLRNNNFLGGSERLSNSIDVNLEIGRRNDAANIESVFNAANLNVRNTLEIPRFADYFGLYDKLLKDRILDSDRYDHFSLGANTIFDIGYEYVDLFRFFNYHSLTMQYGFRSNVSGVNERRQTDIIHPSVTVFDPTIRQDFDSLYSEQTFAKKSFAPQLFTSILFNRLTFSRERLQGQRGFSYAWLGDIELSGLEILAINALANGLDRPFSIGNLTFAHFGKIDLEGRLYKQLTPEQVLAFRAGFGIAVPYGPSDVIPYVKQFYLGGPLSMRAWRIRELGPGSYEDTTITRRSGNPFFQAGDLKILFNAEYRFDIFWRIEGALFVDAGNIWTLERDERTGGLFTSRFLRQMAVGSGAGMRFDADYFKVVLDLGLKLRNPYPDENGQYGAIQEGIPPRELLNWNFAINYPF